MCVQSDSNIGGIKPEDEQRIHTEVRKACAEVLQLAWQINKSKSCNALLGFLVRGMGSWKSIIALVHSAEDIHEENAIALDCAAILRCMFDAYIQAHYIVVDPTSKEDRAELYLNFKIIERQRRISKVLKTDNQFARFIAKSPLRAEGEKRNQQEFDQVHSNYLIPGETPGINNMRSYRTNWYKGNLRQLSQAFDKEDEYVIFVDALHGAIHSGPSAVFNGPGIPLRTIPAYADVLVCRIAKLLIDNDELDVAGFTATIIDAMVNPVLTEITKQPSDRD